MTYTPEERREYERKYREANREKLRAYAKAWREANPDRVKAAQAKYRDANPALYQENARRWYENNKPAITERRKAAYRSNKMAVRERKLIAKYGMTLESYAAMLEKQGGKCDICGLPESDATFGRLVVDHDHSTGAVRSLLCSKCNAGIGMLGDNTELLQRAIAYLDKHRAVTH